ncbi:MAG: hypothetical protein M3O99_05115 [Chloroflexota bacterium]|nr:hypothetical protein [Chloroflexota bacterium]
MTVLKMPTAANPGRLEIYMRRAMELVLAKAKAYDSPLREAAFIVAVERVASAITKRGIFP